MDIQVLKLQLVRELVNTNDGPLLVKMMRLLELLRTKGSEAIDQRGEELLAAAAQFGESAYGDDEPDISGLILKEPNPNYGE
ncbi:MAG: hypothetical protein IT225_06525 [Flavobacteriales bacterium]|jgi:hypothetical protein|nr:hypothetical protein [Flavobacteriales bacterium]TXI82899.1 MAG: hypothetical protein E6Q44_00715 [Flavobacteriales bacterium]